MLKDVFQIGRIRVEPERNLLVSEHGSYKLEPRIMDVLCVLAAAPGTVHTRETLIGTIWNVEHGADESLTRAVSVIRRTLKDAGETGQIIETIPRRGYRLAAPVLDPAPARDPAPAQPENRHPNRETQPPATGDFTASNKTRPLLTSWRVQAAIAGVLAAMAILFVARLTPDTQVTRADRSHSVAVLPFEPLSADESDERFAFGVTEDLINALSAVEGLSVAARASSSSFRGTAANISQIGTALDVSFIVDGTVRRNRDTVRVTAQLIQAADGIVVWSDTLEEPVTDTFALEDEIVREIGLALELRLGVGSGKGLAPDSDLDPQAIDFYYRGLQQYGNRFLENGSVQAARQSLRAAVEIEPEFAKAWSALVRIGISWSSGPLARDKEAFLDSLENDMVTALALGPDDPALHAALVQWHAKTTLDLEKAQFHLSRAEALAPDAVDTLVAGSVYYWVVGKGERSLDLIRRAQRRDPLNDLMKLAVALRQTMLGDFDTAFEFFDACQASDCLQEGFTAYASAAAIYSGDGERQARWSDIYDAFEAFAANLPASLLPKVVEIQGAFFSTGFSQSDAQEEQARARSVFDREIVTDHIGMWGPTFAETLPEETFFETLETAYERGDLLSSPYAFSPFYGANPYPDRILEHPRYHRLWARPGLAGLAEARRANGQTAGLPK